MDDNSLYQSILKKLEQIISTTRSIDGRVERIEAKLKDIEVASEQPPMIMGDAPVKETPLPAPTDLTARAIAFNSIQLTWSLEPCDYDIVIMRKKDGRDFIEGWRGASTGTWIDNAVMPGAVYEYEIFTEHGNKRSEVATTPAITAPRLVNVTAQIEKNDIILQWKVIGDFSGSFIIQRRSGLSKTFENIGTIKNSSTFKDSSASHGYTFFYKIIPLNELGEKEAGLETSISVPAISAPVKEDAVKKEPVKAPVVEKQAPVRVSKGKDATEKLLGGNWLSKIGIIIFVLGIIYFLKYSFDNNWVGPWGRVSIGFIIGVSLLGLGEFFNSKKYHLHAQIFTAGGILIIYASFLAATHLYNLIGPYLTLAFLAATSALCALAAIRYDSITIAALGVVGAYIAPLVIGVKSGRVFPFLSYLTIINSGAFAMIFFKKWRPILWAALLFAGLLPLLVVMNKDPIFLLAYLIIFVASGLYVLLRLGWMQESFVLIILGFTMPLAASYSSAAHAASLPIYLIALLCIYMFGFKKIAHQNLISALFFALMLLPLLIREFPIDPSVILPAAIFGAILWMIRQRAKISPIITYSFWALLNVFPLFIVLRSGLQAPLLAPFAIYAAYFIFASIAVVIYCLRNEEYWTALIASALSFGLSHFWLYKNYNIYPLNETGFLWQFMLFVSCNFAAYLAPSIYNSLRKKLVTSISFSVFTTAVAFLYFMTMYYPLKEHYPEFSSIFAILLSVVYMGIGYIFYHGQAAASTDKKLSSGQLANLLLVIGVSLSFIAIAAVVQFRDARITTFIWTLEAFFVLWAGLKIGKIGVRLGAAILLLLALGKGLTIDFWYHYEFDHWIFINPRFVVLASIALALGGASYLYKRYERNISSREANVSQLALLACNVLVFASVMNELGRFLGGGLKLFAQQVYFALHGGVIAVLFKKVSWLSFRATCYALFAIASCLWLWNTFNTSSSERPATTIIANWYFAASLIFAVFSFLLYKLMFRAEPLLVAAEQRGITPLLIFANVTLLASFSAESYYHFIDKSDGLNIVTMSWAIMWGIYAFLLMGLGFIKEFRALRILSLVIFGITILKLFIYDVWFLGKIYRILAFVILGIVLLVSSLLYQKFRTKIVDGLKVKD